MDRIAYRYVADRNPDGRWLPGVPLRDLAQAEIDDLPDWLLRSVEWCPFYEREPGEETSPAARMEDD